MEKVLKSISAESGHTDRDLQRSSSLPQVLTFRSSLRRFLTRSNSLSPVPPTKASRWSGGGGKGAISASDADEFEGQRGGMSVLLMSQELHLEGNQEDFLKRFTATQASVCPSVRLSVCLIGFIMSALMSFIAKQIDSIEKRLMLF